MNFRQILAKYSQIDCKNKLNDLLAEVERSFGVFSRDMELDIRSIISVPEVVDYFDRIIHDQHPQLEYDPIKKQSKKEARNPQAKSANDKKKPKKKKESLIPKRKDLKPITYGEEESIVEKKRRRLPHDEYVLRKLAQNGRDYSKPTLESQISRSRITEGKEKPKQWLKIVSVPMGGMNKKY